MALDSLDRTVVIKECFPAAICRRQGTQVDVRHASDRKDFARLVAHFESEARRLAHLSHPNIVGVHQVFADNGTAYFALDLIRGHSLLEIIEGTAEALPPTQIKALLLTLLQALGYLHSCGILHRDIAPDNILLRDNGEPVLIDFGAAQGQAGPSGSADTGLSTVKDGYSPYELYLPGSVEGPPGDLYALAATFYHLITGQPPPDAPARVMALNQGDPDPYLPLTDFDQRFDRWFTGALNQAMALRPGERPATAEDWIYQIHEPKRRAAALERAKRDQHIELSISQLVAQTNAAAQARDNALAAPATPPTPPNNAATPATPAPKNSVGFPEPKSPPLNRSLAKRLWQMFSTSGR